MKRATLRWALGAAPLAALLWPAVGYPQLWKCLGPDGEVTYTNEARLIRGKQCTALTLAPTPKGNPAASRAQPQLSGERPPPVAARSDALRRQILTAEHEGERAQIAALQAQLAAAPDEERRALEARLARHRRNLEALQRELSRLP